MNNKSIKPEERGGSVCVGEKNENIETLQYYMRNNESGKISVQLLALYLLFG